MPERKPVIDRRAAIGGAATVSAAAVAAALLPGGRGAEPMRSAQASEATPSAPGYRLTDHIRQYYARARI